jgi:uncharacterized protein YcnI
VETPRTARRHAGRRAVAGALVAAAAAVVPAAVASAHTETDFVAVPAGSTATVTFEPEHGCGDSPTIDMQVQAPVADARAVDKAGWTATATPDGEGNTVLEWSGGSQPAHESGSFQVEFTVPDAVGTLLAFPAVQHCANGQQEAWIETDPGAESPAPQLLVLAAGSQPAATLADVPAGAPGRAQLAALAAPDDDAAPATTAAGAVPAPTTSAATTAPAASAPATAVPLTTAATAPATAETTTAVAAGGGSGGSSAGWVIGLIIAAAVIVALVVTLVLRRRRASPTA